MIKPTIDFLITVVNKTKDEIIKIVRFLNVSGNIIVGNQLSLSDSTEDLVIDNNHIKIINMNSKGVSLNRNTLLKNSESDYVTFCDDDMHFSDGVMPTIYKSLLLYNDYKGIRFNSKSLNRNRPIEFVNEGEKKFKDLTCFGVCGIFFNRKFLIDNNLWFNQNIGPGTKINHGEDGVFLNEFLKKAKKIYNLNENLIEIKQQESTWHTNRDLHIELFSHGYNYYLLFKRKAVLRSYFFVLTHMNCYPPKTKRKDLIRWMKEGIECSRKENPTK